MRAPVPHLVYSPRYDIEFFGIERLHPFDSRKHSRAWKELQRTCMADLAGCTMAPPRQVSTQELLTVHTEEYLDQLRSPSYVSRIFGVPLPPLPTPLLRTAVDQHVLAPMRLATMGTIVAAETALSYGCAINFSGGYHHASRDRGDGFCVYADIPIAVALLRQQGTLQADDTVLIVDLDAHQGNGLERIFRDDPAIRIFDMFNQDIYPGDYAAQQRIDRMVPLSSGTEDDAYLHTLRANLAQFLEDSGRPRIGFYNAGTDIYVQDSLGHLAVSDAGVLARDSYVFDALSNAGIPWVMVLSGGYSRQSYLLIARSVQYVLERWGGYHFAR